MASLFASATRRSTSAAGSSLASSSSSASLACSSSSPCPSKATISYRLFSTTASAYGKSRPGEGKDTLRAIRRAKRLGLFNKQNSSEEVYTLADAFRTLKANQIYRPLSAIEVHIITTVPRNQSNAFRGRLFYPHSPSVRPTRLLIFSSEGTEAYEAALEAQRNGASIILGGEDLIQKVATNQVEGFDKVLASPDIMAPLARALARSLGPKGLMPNSKRGTIAESAQEMKAAIDEAMGGSDWRADRQSEVRTVIGRINFQERQVRDNMRTILGSILERVSAGLGSGAASTSQSDSALKIASRPEGVPAPPDVQKRAASIVKQLHISSSQGPSVLLDVKECL